MLSEPLSNFDDSTDEQRHFLYAIYHLNKAISCGIYYLKGEPFFIDPEVEVKLEEMEADDRLLDKATSSLIFYGVIYNVEGGRVVDYSPLFKMADGTFVH